MSLESFEIDRNKQEQDEQNMELQWKAFKPDAVARVKECFNEDGDLVDLVNTLDLEYDEDESLSNTQINEIVFEAVGQLLYEEGRL